MPQQVKTPGTGAGAAGDAALLARATRYTLPSGREVYWLAPDEMQMLAFTGTLPDPITASVYQLLRDEGSLPPDKDDPASYQREFNQRRAMMVIAKHGLIKPKFDPEREIGDDQVWGRRDLPRPDLNFLYYWLFRLGTTPEALRDVERGQSGGVAGAPLDSGDVPPDASAADGDQRPADGVLHQSGLPVGGDAPAEAEGSREPIEVPA